MPNRLCFGVILACTFLLSAVCTLLLADDAKPRPAGSGAAAEVGTVEYVEKALKKTVKLRAMDERLTDVADDLGEQAGLSIQFDRRELDSVGLVPADLKVSKNLKGLSLRSVLRNVLSEFELTYTYYEGVLMITTPEAADVYLVTLVYDVIDLIGGDESQPEDYDYDSLIELITSTVSPESWDAVGGPGSISGFRGTIVVSQAAETHEDIVQLLAAARKAKQIAAEHKDKAPPVVSIPLSDPTSAEENATIERALDAMATVEFTEKPLNDVVEALSNKFKLPIELSERQLADVGIATDTPITISVKHVNLRQALRFILRDLDLTFNANNGVLTITTPEECEQNLITRAYPILDMVDVAPAAFGLPLDEESPGYDYDSLIKLTTTAIAPDTWDEVGGPGSLAVMNAHGFFVISQTYQVHKQIEELYTKLRRAVAAKPRKAAKKENNGQVRLAIYAVPSYRPEGEADARKTDEKAEAKEGGEVLPRVEGGFDGGLGGGFGGGGLDFGQVGIEGPLPDEKELLSLITTLIEPESWQTRDDVYARAVTGRLIIRHTESVHQQIKKLATRLAIPDFREISEWQPPLPGPSGFF